MNLNDYQASALRTADPTQSPRDRLANAALGLAGEAGEAADCVKKHLYHGHTLDRDALIKELGDVLWYVALLADALGVGLEDVARGNLAKLRARYPDGFEVGRSVNRGTGDE